jgi:diaminohydroxyphosphoribosylaminopyrimidine deaminase / 5-amino-6-(5-phosphoribosylamino)uracil reductase
MASQVDAEILVYKIDAGIMASQIDVRRMAVAIALSQRGRAVSSPNPNVGCVIMNGDVVVGRGWTQSGGRPHAEAMALEQAGDAARGATAYVSLEPCAHISTRGPACADALIAAGVTRVVVACTDPDPRTNGQGVARLRAASIEVTSDVCTGEARHAMAGWISVMERRRPYVTLKLATSLDGCIALSDGSSKWITGAEARAHAHLERARSNMILVGRGTYNADAPKLDVRINGLEHLSHTRAILSRAPAPDGWVALTSPDAIADLPGVQYLMIEGGAGAAAAFLRAGLVDRIMLYRAPVMIGAGKASLGDIGLENLAGAHGQWQRSDTRQLGKDSLEVYERI